MKLLVITQKVNKSDSNLGFFHEWLERLANKIEKITIICLEKREYDLPRNVEVLSLGKEKKKSRFFYLWNFYKYIFKYKNDYDGIFVHMNAEYVLLGGLLWRIWGKKILLWYTHKAVNWHLRLGVTFADKIFTASKESFRLPSKKVEVVGHGIDVQKFASPVAGENMPSRQELRLLAVGRISPVKDLEVVVKGVEALCHLFLDHGVPSDYRVNLTIVGEAITLRDEEYKKKLEEIKNKSGVGWFINFMGPVPYAQMPLQYQRHHILIHTSRTGSIDKVVLEALAAGRIVITSSEAFADLAKEGIVLSFPAGDARALADKIMEIYKSGLIENLPIQKNIEYVREHHNLDNLIKKIADYYR